MPRVRIPILVNMPYTEVRPNIERMMALEVGAEVFVGNNLIDEIDLDEMRRIGQELRGRSITFTLHAPYMDLSPGGVDKKVVEISRDRLKKAVEIANIMGARGIVCHPGYDKWRFDGNEQLWLDGSIETWKQVLEHADKGLLVMLENIFEEQPSTFLSLFGYFREKLWFCFDSGHFNLFSKVSVDEWLVPLKDYIREFHLHDNHGKSDQHLPIGRGNFPFRELKQFLQRLPDIVCVAEIADEEIAIDAIKSATSYLA
jgi:sugar phosphate isomerase/epimerase